VVAQPSSGRSTFHGWINLYRAEAQAHLNLPRHPTSAHLQGRSLAPSRSDGANWPGHELKSWNPPIKKTSTRQNRPQLTLHALDRRYNALPTLAMAPIVSMWEKSVPKSKKQNYESGMSLSGTAYLRESR
jgi:hypothetical protein